LKLRGGGKNACWDFKQTVERLCYSNKRTSADGDIRLVSEKSERENPTAKGRRRVKGKRFDCHEVTRGEKKKTRKVDFQQRIARGFYGGCTLPKYFNLITVVRLEKEPYPGTINNER